LKLEKEFPIKIYPYDVDYMKIVHNSVYVRWLEQMRIDFLSDYFTIKDTAATNLTPIIHQTNMTYMMPVQMEDSITGKIRVKNIGRSKWEVEFEIFSEKGVHFKAQQTGIFFDMSKNKPARIPAHIQDAFKSAVQEG